MAQAALLRHRRANGQVLQRRLRMICADGTQHPGLPQLRRAAEGHVLQLRLAPVQQIGAGHHPCALRRHQIRHLLVALVTILDHPVQHRAQRIGLRVDEIAQDVDRTEIGGADLDPGDHLQTETDARLRRLPVAGRGVVVGDGDGGQAEACRQRDDLRRAIGPVGGGGMHMQVNSLHGSWLLFLKNGGWPLRVWRPSRHGRQAPPRRPAGKAPPRRISAPGR